MIFYRVLSRHSTYRQQHSHSQLYFVAFSGPTTFKLCRRRARSALGSRRFFFFYFSFSFRSFVWIKWRPALPTFVSRDLQIVKKFSAWHEFFWVVFNLHVISVLLCLSRTIRTWMALYENSIKKIILPYTYHYIS